MGAAPLRVAAPSAGNSCRTVVTMAKKGKDVRLMITLECTEQKASGVSGMSRYTSEKARNPVPGTSGEARVSGLAVVAAEPRAALCWALAASSAVERQTQRRSRTRGPQAAERSCATALCARRFLVARRLHAAPARAVCPAQSAPPGYSLSARHTRSLDFS